MKMEIIMLNQTISDLLHVSPEGCTFASANVVGGNSSNYGYKLTMPVKS
jgi:hypothetical protein